MIKRDIELLSAYLDGELKTSDSTKLEARLKTDPELASVLNDLRAARTLLRKLPSRKAPRNFTLTRKMAGQNPPLPRTYPAFRFVTTIATLLFFFTFGLNFIGAQMASPAPAFGMGGGGGSDTELFSAEEAPAMDSAVATEEPAMAEPAAPAPVEPEMATATSEDEPSIALAPPAGTEMPSTEDATRIMETPVLKNGEAENSLEQGQPQVPDEAPSPQSTAPLIPPTLQIALLTLAVLGALFMVLMRQFSARRWK